jgi:hypothetical protein
VVGLHVGVAPLQSALMTQATQVAVVGLQTGVAPVQRVVFVTEQTPHDPFASQAGVAPPHSASVPQPRHTWVVRLHTGVVPEQFVLATQATHVPAAVSHAGVAPEHLVAFVAEHAPHAPLG